MKLHIDLELEELFLLNDLLRIHESTALKRTQEKEPTGLEMEYATRIMRARDLLNMTGVGATFKVPQFVSLASLSQESTP